MKNIWIFGDSILRGVVWSNERNRYITTTEIGFAEMEQAFGVSLHNRSRFGTTLCKGVEHLFSVLKRGECCDVAILEYGGNDSDFNWKEIAASPESEHYSKTSLVDFCSSYRSALQTLKNQGILPVVCTLVPVCGSRYLNWVSKNDGDKESILRWLGTEEAICRYQEQYSRSVEAVAREEGCPQIDLRAAFLSVRHMEDYFCEDGIHPNEKGQRLLRATLERALSSLLPKVS